MNSVIDRDQLARCVSAIRRKHERIWKVAGLRLSWLLRVSVAADRVKLGPIAFEVAAFRGRSWEHWPAAGATNSSSFHSAN
jgi:hypothetical protein